MPIKPNDTQREFYNKVFNEKLQFSSIFFKKKTENKLNSILDEILSKNTKSVLEIGCGNGLLTQYLIKRNLEITALDISNEAIQVLTKQYPKKIHNNLDLVCNDLTIFLKNTTKKFDIIIGSGIIHHIEKTAWDKMFKLSHDSLNDGGIFICAPEPNASGIYCFFWPIFISLLSLFNTNYSWGIEKGTLNMNLYNIKKSLEKSGFSKIYIEPYQVIPYFNINFLSKINDYLMKKIPAKYSMYIKIKAIK